MTPEICLRQATLADLGTLLALEQTFPGDQLSRRSFRHLLTKGNDDVLVLEKDAALLGDAVVLYRKGSSSARLYSLVVAPAARGQGLGARLLGAVEAAARERGCTELRLEVREDNTPAIALYENAGFDLSGRIEDYYDDHSAALRFGKRLG